MECSKCHKITEDERSFATFRDSKGIVRRRGICKTCRGLRAQENFEHLQKWRKEYNEKTCTKRQLKAKHNREVSRKYIDDIKRVTPCADCNRIFPPICMDFDHIKNNKIKSVSSYLSGAYKLDLIKEEISKCELVCACCHRIRTQNKKQNLTPLYKIINSLEKS